MVNSDLIGSSRKFQAVLDDVQVVAPAECAVLIQGETGTGKEVIARAIHDSGPRQSGPFVGLNCAAIPGALLESELFGHEKGAFTGAVTQTIGRFQAAHGGTLFLDEIGERVMDVLRSHHWPGNIRELQNFVERSVIMTQGKVLSPRIGELKLLMQETASAPTQTLSDAERAHILGILKETKWVVGGRDGAAARLGLPRTTLISRMQKLGISSKPRDLFVTPVDRETLA